MKAKATKCIAFCMLTWVLAGTASQAEDKSSQGEGWEVVVAPYLWMAGIEGDVTVKGMASSTDADFGDVLENLDIGGQGYFLLRKGKWGGFADITYLRVAADAQAGARRVDIELSSTLAELGVLYRVYEGFAGSNPVATDVSVSGRYVELDTELDFAAIADREGNQNWWDPIVGATYSRALSDKWAVTASADIGGFGVASDLTWSLRLMGAYRLNDWAKLWLGYRYLDIDYDDGSGTSKFVYDVAMHGPILGASFHF